MADYQHPLSINLVSLDLLISLAPRMTTPYPVEMYRAYMKTIANEVDGWLLEQGELHPHEFANAVRGELSRAMNRIHQISGQVRRISAAPAADLSSEVPGLQPVRGLVRHSPAPGPSESTETAELLPHS